MTSKIEQDRRLAEQSVAQAETDLSALLASLTTSPHAEKIGVSAPLEAALRALKDALAVLAALRADEG